MAIDLQVVLGASGGVGRALVMALSAQGRPVRAVSRGGTGQEVPGVEYLAADVSRPEGAKLACAGASVVYHAAQPPYDQWPQRFPAMTAAIVEGVAAAGAKLVMVDNLYMYGPQAGPYVETMARAATGAKGAVRAAMEQQLLAAHRAGHARVTIGRSSDYYGPHGHNSTVAALVLEPAVRGRTMRWVGRTDQAHTLHHLDDAVGGLLTLAEHDRADGEVWHLPAAGPITGEAFMALVNDCLPAPVRPGSIGPWSMRLAGLFSADAKETVECLYQWTAPFVIDSSKFEAAFGPLSVTPHTEAVPATVEWIRRQGQARR
jgi:nucleoside-diphosphate-sugar epimerase